MFNILYYQTLDNQNLLSTGFSMFTSMESKTLENQNLLSIGFSMFTLLRSVYSSNITGNFSSELGKVFKT